MEWEPNEIRYYVDGTLQHTARSSITGTLSKFSIASGAYGCEHWGGCPDGSTPSQSTAQVDYVRIFKRDGANSELANNQRPTGYLDGIDAYGNASGWAVDGDSPASSIRVDFYIDGRHDQGGKYIGSAYTTNPPTGSWFSRQSWLSLLHSSTVPGR